MNKNWLWAAAILAVVIPWMVMSSGTTDAMSGAAKMALAQQMRVQAMMFESQLGDILGASLQSRPLDAALLKEITDQLNGQNGGPKAIPWMVAPAKQPRSLSIGVVGKDLLIRGWGTDLKEPIYEHTLRNVISEPR